MPYISGSPVKMDIVKFRLVCRFLANLIAVLHAVGLNVDLLALTLSTDYI